MKATRTTIRGFARAHPENISLGELRRVDPVRSGDSEGWREVSTNVRVLNEALARAAGFGEILTLVIERVKQLVGAEMAGVMLHDPESDELILQQPLGATVAGAKRCRIAMNDGGQAVSTFRTGQPHMSNDPWNDPLPLRRFVELYRARNSISVPLQVSGRSIGVLHVYNKQSGDFTERDLQQLYTLAGHLGPVIENSRLVHVQQGTIKHLREQADLIQGQNDNLERIVSIQNDFLQIVLDGQGVHAIAVALGKLLACPVTVVDQFLNIIAQYQREETDPGRGERSYPPDDLPRSAAEAAINSAKGRLGVDFKEPSACGPSVSVPLVASGETMGHLLVMTGQRLLDVLDVAIIDCATLAMAMAMTRERAAVQARYGARGDLVVELINGTYGQDDVFLERAACLGIDFRPSRSLIVFEVDDGRKSNHSSTRKDGGAPREKLLAIAARVSRQRDPHSVVALRDGHIVVLTKADGASQKESNLQMSRLADALREEIVHWMSGVVVYAGIGPTCGCLKEYQHAYEQARCALEVVKACRHGGGALAYDELGIRGLLFDPHNRSSLASFVESNLGNLLEYDGRRGTQLTETLHMYLAQDCRLEHTARELNIHLNTLRYRLQRIEEITKTSLRGVETRSNYYLALEAWRSVCRANGATAY